jgi:hypothetical protein
MAQENRGNTRPTHRVGMELDKCSGGLLVGSLILRQHSCGSMAA